MRWTLLLLLALLPTMASADLTVEVKVASAVTTTSVTDCTQLTTGDGDAIGPSTTVTHDPVVRPGKPAAVMVLHPSVPLDALRVITECETAKVENPIPGVFYVDTPGTHQVEFRTLSLEPFSWDSVKTIITVGAPTPSPIDPVIPPVPPDGLPIDGMGLRVLVVYETSDLQRLNKESHGQFITLYAPELRSWLTANCVKDASGMPEWRFLDPDVPYTDANDVWSKALAKPRTSLPWIAISNGVTGFAGPLPSTPEDSLALVKGYIPANKSMQPKPKIVVFTEDNCVRCEQWKATVAPQLAGRFDIEYSKDGHYITSYPSFQVNEGSRGVFLEGYQTASQIETTLQTIRGVN